MNDFNLDPDPADERDIVAKCSKLWPQLDPSRIIGTNVGLRPSRSVVRWADATPSAPKISL